MKSNTVNYLVVGVFVIAMLAGTIVAIAALSGRAGPTDIYYTEYDDVTGIKFGTKVLYMGFPVGQVESITPRWEDDGGLVFELALSVGTDWRGRIPDDSEAVVSASGLLAAVVLDIRAGRSPEPLEPGETIDGLGKIDAFAALVDTANTIKDVAENEVKPLIENLRGHIDGFGTVLASDGTALVTDLRSVSAKLSADAPELIENFLELSRDIRATNQRLNQILGAENAAKIGNILTNAETASANVSTLTEDEKIQQTLVNVRDASKYLEELSRDARTRLGEVLGEQTVTKLRNGLDNIALAARNVADLSRDLRASRERLEHFLETLDQVATENRGDIRQSISDVRHTMEVIDDRISTIVHNLEGTSRNMREFSRQLRQNPGALLGGQPPADTAGY